MHFPPVCLQGAGGVIPWPQQFTKWRLLGWGEGTREGKDRREYTCVSFHALSISIKTLKSKMEVFFWLSAHFLSPIRFVEVQNAENFFLLRGNHEVVACSAYCRLLILHPSVTFLPRKASINRLYGNSDCTDLPQQKVQAKLTAWVCCCMVFYVLLHLFFYFFYCFVAVNGSMACCTI